MKSPAVPPPGLPAAATMASAALACWKRSMGPTLSRKPPSSTPRATPRVMAWVISSGSEMFMVMSGISRPYSSSTRSATKSRSLAESSTWRPWRSMTPRPVSSTRSEKARVITRRSSSVISSISTALSVPMTSFRKISASATLTTHSPLARTCTIRKSGSRTVTGCGVPHRRSVTGRVLMKYTSLRNGLSKPCFHPCRVDRTGRFSVVSSKCPGPKRSASWPR